MNGLESLHLMLNCDGDYDITDCWITMYKNIRCGACRALDHIVEQTANILYACPMCAINNDAASMQTSLCIEVPTTSLHSPVDHLVETLAR